MYAGRLFEMAGQQGGHAFKAGPEAPETLCRRRHGQPLQTKNPPGGGRRRAIRSLHRRRAPVGPHQPVGHISRPGREL